MQDILLKVDSPQPLISVSMATDSGLFTNRVVVHTTFHMVTSGNRGDGRQVDNLGVVHTVLSRDEVNYIDYGPARARTNGRVDFLEYLFRYQLASIIDQLAISRANWLIEELRATRDQQTVVDFIRRYDLDFYAQSNGFIDRAENDIVAVTEPLFDTAELRYLVRSGIFRYTENMGDRFPYAHRSTELLSILRSIASQAFTIRGAYKHVSYQAPYFADQSRPILGRLYDIYPAR